MIKKVKYQVTLVGYVELEFDVKEGSDVEDAVDHWDHDLDMSKFISEDIQWGDVEEIKDEPIYPRATLTILKDNKVMDIHSSLRTEPNSLKHIFSYIDNKQLFVYVFQNTIEEVTAFRDKLGIKAKVGEYKEK